jgi:NTE family protein
MRASFGAVNVRTGRMHYFDTRDMRLDVRHVMASGSLPPAFPAIEIDGEHYYFWTKETRVFFRKIEVL